MKKSKVVLITEIIGELSVNQEVNKNEVIDKIYNEPMTHKDEFKRRSFDVALCNAKKKLPNMKFKTSSSNIIKRIL